MNEKYLWELWAKCKHPHPEYGGGDMVWPMEFAELIVRECLDISYRESHLPNAVLFDERSDKFIKDIHNRVDRATREHFGVEE